MKKKAVRKTKRTEAPTISPPEELGQVPDLLPLEDAQSLAMESPQEAACDYPPTTSPYASATVALRFGEEAVEYNVPSAFLPSSLVPDYGFHRYLSNVDPDIAHPLVHFLYTGKYETLPCGEATLAAIQVREHERALGLYDVAREYGMVDLQVLAKEKVLSVASSVPTEEILRQLEAVFSNISDEDEFLASRLTDTLRKTFPASADPSYEIPCTKLGSRFAREILISAATIFANLKETTTCGQDGTSHMEESYRMPAPPEEPAEAVVCPASPDTAGSDGLTHDSFSVISCNGGEDEAGLDYGKDDVDFASTDVPCYNVEPEPCAEDTKPSDSAAGEELGEPCPAAVEASADDYVYASQPAIVQDQAALPCHELEPTTEKSPSCIAEYPDEYFVMPVKPKKKKKKGRFAAVTPASDWCRLRMEHLTAGWESCSDCRNFVLSMAQEQHQKMFEASYGY